MRYLLLAVLASCGGAPFAAGQLVEHDSLLDASSEASAPADSGPGGDEPTEDGGGEADGGTDGRVGRMDAACELLPTTQGQRAYSCAPYAHPDGAPIDGPVPTYFAWQTGSTCGIAPTPAECQCASAFDCACLQAANVCATITGTAWVTCVQTTNMPLVTCQ